MNRPLVAVNGIKCVYRFRERKKKKKKKTDIHWEFCFGKTGSYFHC